jgi:hypothetical protein
LELPDIRDCRGCLHRPILTWVALVLRGFVGQNWKGVKRGEFEEGGPVA